MAPIYQDYHLASPPQAFIRQGLVMHVTVPRRRGPQLSTCFAQHRAIPPQQAAGIMASELYQGSQCTCSAIFLTSEGLDSHLEENRVSALHIPSVLLTPFSHWRPILLLVSKYAGVTQRLTMGMTHRQKTRMIPGLTGAIQINNTAAL